MATKKKVAKKKVAKKPSAKLSKAITNFILMKTNITAASKQLEAMKSEAHKLEGELMVSLEKLDQTGASVKAGSIKFSEKDVFNAKDWKKINAWVLKNKNFDIYQRRLSSTILNDMFKDKKRVPGIEHFVKKSLSHSKVKAE